MVSSQPYVIYAFFASAGVTLCCGLQAFLGGVAGQDRGLHFAFAITCVAAAGFQVSTAGYYLAPTVPEAITALHWQMFCTAAAIGPLFAFIAKQTGQQKLQPWLTLMLAAAAALLVLDQLTPGGLRFESVQPAAPLHLPWGEDLGHVVGHTGYVNRLVFMVPYWIICGYGLCRSVLQFRAGKRRMALFLAACMALLMLSGIWGACIDLGVVRSFYVAGFAFMGLVVLMSFGLASRQAGILADLRLERDRQRQLRAELEASETRMRLVLKGSNDAWWDWHIDTGETYYSERGWQMLGYADQELPYGDELWERLIFPADRERGRQIILGAIERGDAYYSYEQNMRHRDGRAVPVLSRGFILRDAQGKAVRVSGTDTDLTAQKAAEVNAYRLAYFDELTDLPNRRLLLDRVGTALEAARRSGQFGALLFVDLDNFKRLNDARGHSLGDRLLVEVAARLGRLLRAGDTVARLGGDEFVVLLNNLGRDLDQAVQGSMAVAEMIRAALEMASTIDGHAYSGTASIGVTMFPKTDDAVDNLLREADTAMYQAKARGRNRIAYFEPRMQQEAEERLGLEQDLKSAIESGEILVYVQPQFDASGTETGGELLLRWKHPRRGMVPPAEFIPIAENSGLILKLGELVLRRACAALTQLDIAGRSLQLSVNISPREFNQDDFVANARAIIKASGAPVANLVFEVTEGLFIDHWQDAAAKMTELTHLGLQFSVDDFGTGYSSLAYLKKLPLKEIKIDKQFVQNTPIDANDRAIVRSIFAVAKAFKLRVVAEGVETQAQADFLAQQQCDGYQGYLYARPMPLEAWLAQDLQIGGIRRETSRMR